MLVSDGISMLDITANIMGRENIIHPTLLQGKDTAILVDSGYPGQLSLIRQAVEQAGVSFESLKKIIVTHQDIDHIGGLPAIRKELHHKVEIISSEVEKPYIQGEQRLVKLNPQAIEQAMASLPPEVQEERRKAFKAILENPPKADVDRTVNDGEELPDCGGITVIATPGHTPGHICLYHRPSKTLIAGDAMVVADGRLSGPLPRATPDMDQALKSLKKLEKFDIAAVICYHGGLILGDVNARIRELADSKSP